MTASLHALDHNGQRPANLIQNVQSYQGQNVLNLLCPPHTVLAHLPCVIIRHFHANAILKCQSEMYIATESRLESAERKYGVL